MSRNCAWRSGASTTPSRRCAPNGRGSTIPLASRVSPGGIWPCNRPKCRQLDRLDNLPERPPELVPLDEPDPIGIMIAHPELLDRSVTGSLPRRRGDDGAHAGRAACIITRRRCPGGAGWCIGCFMHAMATSRSRRGLASVSSSSSSRRLCRDCSTAGHVRGSARGAGGPGVTGSHDAVATARPDILDRNGEILATDVRIALAVRGAATDHRRRRSIRVAHRVMPDSDAGELRERLGSKRRFVWLKREITSKQQRANSPARHPGHRLPAREQARLSERGRKSRT